MENNLVNTLSMLAGAFLSLVFMYVPKIRDWYELKTKTEKRGWMLATVLLTATVVWVVGCYNLVPGYVSLTCDNKGISDLILAIFLTISSNQTFYKIWPKKDDDEEVPPLTFG